MLVLLQQSIANGSLRQGSMPSASLASADELYQVWNENGVVILQAPSMQDMRIGIAAMGRCLLAMGIRLSRFSKSTDWIHRLTQGGLHMQVTLENYALATRANVTNGSHRLYLPLVQRTWQLRSVAMSGFVLLTLSLLFPGRVSAQARTLLAINEAESTLSIIDPKTGRELARIAEGGVAGHEVVASPDGTKAYVPIYSDSFAGRPGSNGSEMVVLDLASHKVIAHVDFGHGVRPHQPVLNPHDGMLYVTTELDRTISVIDPASMKIVGTIPTGQALTHMLVLDHAGRLGYTANIEPGSVSVLDLRARKLLAVIPVAPKMQRIAISVDDKKLFTADQTNPRVAVIDTATRQVASWIPLPAIGYTLTTTQDGRWLLVGFDSESKVAVIDLRSDKVVRTIDLPASPSEILMSPDGSIAYVSCTDKQEIAAISVSDWTVTKLIQAGKRVDGLAWAVQP